MKAGLVSDVDGYLWSSWHEYCLVSGDAPSICEKSFILDQVELEDLSTWVKQPMQSDDCSSIEEDEHPSDDDVCEMLHEMLLGVDNLEVIAHLPKKKRNEIIVSVLQKEAGIRQLERITGIGFGIIQRLKTKKTYQKLRPRDRDFFCLDLYTNMEQKGVLHYFRVRICGENKNSKSRLKNEIKY